MITLLDSRSLATSYPTDVALQQMFQGEGNGSRLLDAIIEVTGTMGGATLGYDISTDGGTTWTTGSYTTDAVGWLGPISMLPGWKIRPALSSVGSTTDVTAKLFP